MIYFDKGDYQSCIVYCDLMMEEVKKSLNRNYGASSSYAYAMQIKEEAMRMKELMEMNAVNRFRKTNPVGFYAAVSVVVGAVTGAAWFVMNKKK